MPLSSRQSEVTKFVYRSVQYAEAFLGFLASAVGVKRAVHNTHQLLNAVNPFDSPLIKFTSEKPLCVSMLFENRSS